MLGSLGGATAFEAADRPPHWVSLEQGLGFRVSGFQGLGFRALGLRVLGFQSFGLRVLFNVTRTGFRAFGFQGCRVFIGTLIIRTGFLGLLTRILGVFRGFYEGY